MSTATVGQRIRARRKQLKYTQAQIAKLSGVTRSALTQWELDKTNIMGDKLLALANALSVTPKWILTGEEPDAKTTVRFTEEERFMRKLPLITYAQAAQWDALSKDMDAIKTDEWPVTTMQLGPRSFALKMQGDSMTNPAGYPSIPEGSLIFIDPDAEIEDGKIVVAKSDKSDTVAIKKLVLDFEDITLRSLNTGYTAFKLDSLEQIIGVARCVVMRDL